MIGYKLHSKSGFTFIELVMTVAIMLILTAIAIPVATNILGTSNSSSDEASAKYMETALTNIYNVAFSGDKKGHHYVRDWEKIDKIQIKDLFKKILVNGTGNIEDYEGKASGYGSVKLSNSNNMNNTYSFVNGKNCFLGKNDLPFLCIKDAQGIDSCKIFYCISYSENEILKCKDTSGNLYIVSSPSGNSFTAIRAEDGYSVDLTYIDANLTVNEYFKTHNIILNGGNDTGSDSDN